MLERMVLRARRKELDRRRKIAKRSALRIESLEPRMLMTANSADPSQFTLSHGSGVCHCPICTGQGLDQIPAYEAAATVGGTSSGSLAAASPLSALPALSSRPTATAKIYLDFNGHTEAAWGEFRNVVTPAYDIDGDKTTFSAAELTNIQQIWARVAEDYAPFNIDVTTVDPGNFANKVATRVAIGGNYSDWFGEGAGGVAYIGGFYNTASNVAYVFEDALGNGNARYVAEAASHEAGHTFGLQHQSLWSGSTLVDAYYEGDANWAPIMGVGYYSARTTWHNGATSNGPSSFQDDMAILANTSNGFGYRADDHGSLPEVATALTGTSVNIAGVIERNGDLDMFSFTTTGGAVNLTLNVAQFGANLDSELRIRSLDGTLFAQSSPTGSLSASVSTTLAAGTYYVVARGIETGANLYGNVGQYTLTGTIPPAGASAPEIDVKVANVAVADGGAVNFGNTTIRTSISRQVTITNLGNQVLALAPIDPATVPAGFSLASNINIYALNPGASYSFTVVMNAAAAGTFGGVLTIANNDSNESPYDLVLSGTVAAAPATAPEIDVKVAGVAVADGGAVNFGSTTVGTPISRQVTITNLGNQVLALAPIDPATVPPGFSLASNINIYALNPGASYSLTVVMNASAAGSFGGVLTIANNDSNESPYGLVLSGTAVAAPQTAVVRTIDNGAAGFTTSGAWYRQTGLGREGDIHYALRGNGSAIATWNFTGLPAGTYRVYATFPANRNYASNSPFKVYNGNTLVGTRAVNQEVLPTSVIDGSRYQLLGTYTITGNQLVVRLTNAANQNVVADAIRIEQVTSAGATFGRGAMLVGSSSVDAIAVDLVHMNSAANARVGGAAASTESNLPARLNAVSQQLASITAKLQNNVNLRAVDHLFTQAVVSAVGARQQNASSTNSLDSLLSDEVDWLSLN